MTSNPFDPYKMLQHMDRVRALAEAAHMSSLRVQRLAALPPVEVDFAISNVCNFRCWYCCDKAVQGARPVKMAQSHIRWILKELGRVGVKAVTFEGGGEPSTGHLANAVAACCHEGMQSGLITNGTLRPSQVETAAALCTWVRVSLNAAYPETHRRMQGSTRTQWNLILSNVERLVKAERLDVGLSFLLCEKNEEEVSDFIALCNELGVSYGQIKEMAGCGDMFRKPLLWMHLAHRSAVPIRVPSLGPKQPYAPRCYGALLTGAYIDPAGEVFACCNQKGVPLYSYGVWEEGQAFEDFWNSEKRRKVVEMLAGGKWDANDQCSFCKIGHVNRMLHSYVHPSAHADFL